MILNAITVKQQYMKSVGIRSFYGPYFAAIGLNTDSLYSVRLRETTDQKNSEYGHFSCSTVCFHKSRNLQSRSKECMRSGKNCDLEKNETDKPCWLEDSSFYLLLRPEEDCI